MISPLLTLVLFALALLVVGFLVAPLLRGGKAALSRGQFDRAVYRDQLKEVERDQARGLLGATEAASARLEIERRLLATATSEGDETGPRLKRPFLGVTLAVGVSVWAIGLYLVLGAPGDPDQPFAARATANPVANGHRNMEDAVAELKTKLESTGGNADDWMLLARTESSLKRWQDAANAYRHLLMMVPDNEKTDLQVAHGEMLVLAAQGIVTPAASASFAAALASFPDEPVARFYMALADTQTGNARRAIDSWLKLAGELPADSELRAEIARRVVEAAGAAGIVPPALPPPAATPSAATPPAADPPAADPPAKP
jgi:cytochrome c-type biogenesis protein CcmH